MIAQRQYDELVMEAAKALPKIAQALADANMLKCVAALYNNGEIAETQMSQVIYSILARGEEPEKEDEPQAQRTRYSDLYWQKRRSGTR